MKSRLLERLLLSADIHAVEQLAPRLRLITLAGPDLADLQVQPGQHVRLQVAASPGAVDWLIGVLRTYTVWKYEEQNLQVVVFDHGPGPGAAWARNVRPGDSVMLLGPQGSFTTTQASYHLFAGEETAQAAFGPMLRALPSQARVFGRIEVESPQEQLQKILVPEPNPNWDLRWSYRQGRSAASSHSLVADVRELSLPDEPGIAYLGGEARTIQLIRNHLVQERHWPRRNVRTKPFWAPGRKGLD